MELIAPLVLIVLILVLGAGLEWWAKHKGWEP